MTCDRKWATRKFSRASLEASIIAYYDSLSDAEVKEDKLWGEFAGLGLVLKEDKGGHSTDETASRSAAAKSNPPESSDPEQESHGE
ncbi:MAG: hypothetical protein LAQ69_30920 [Acidobacteriia bacterium]|nr:hypothetical protein [Terriglobia bacterium]